MTLISLQWKIVNLYTWKEDILNNAGLFLNIKTPSKAYRHSHYKDKMVSPPSNLYSGNLSTCKDGLYIEAVPCS